MATNTFRCLDCEPTGRTCLNTRFSDTLLACDNRSAAAFLRGFKASYFALLYNFIVLGWVLKGMGTVAESVLGIDPQLAVRNVGGVSELKQRLVESPLFTDNTRAFIPGGVFGSESDLYYGCRGEACIMGAHA